MSRGAAFWGWVDKDAAGGCWLWTGATSVDGYGVFAVGVNKGGGSLNARAHRFAYEMLVGPIPGGLTLDHLCRVRHCVNPAHLEPVTVRENTMRGGAITARNARKTHCVNGHELVGPNLYRAPDGTRECRTCRRDATRRYRARLAAK